MKPSVGRVVHYVSHGSPVREDGTQAYVSECRAAIITEVKTLGNATGPTVVGLCVLNPTGQFFCQGVEEALGTIDLKADPRTVTYPGGSWHWPERVD